MAEPELTPSKLALRRTVRTLRSARSLEEQQATAVSLASVALELPRIRSASCVALYASMPGEPDTGVLRQELRRRGTRVLLPVIVDDTTLDWAQDDGTLNPGALRGIDEPGGERLGTDGVGQAQVVLVPAQAVDTRGSRLGRGRGYYDRALTHAAPDALILALIHDDELLDAEATPVQRERHDRDVHGVVTPTRWIYFNRAVED
jgi:5-formyltetrahydrofolate cyclo-ligase